MGNDKSCAILHVPKKSLGENTYETYLVYINSLSKQAAYGKFFEFGEMYVGIFLPSLVR